MSTKTGGDARARNGSGSDGVFFDACGVALCAVAPNGDVIRLNRRMRALLELEDGAAPESLCPFASPESASALKETIVRAMGGDISETDAEIMLASNRRLAVRLSISPFPAQEPTGVIVAAIPLEPYREAAQAADSRRSEARRFESLGMLAGGIAHDFNNMLVGIVGGAGLIDSDIPADSPARKHLSLIADTARRIANLTQQMLAFSGHGHVMMESVDLSTLVDGECDGLSDLARECGCQVSFALEEHLPLVQGDSFQLRKVLHALVSNAAEVMEGCGGAIEVRTRVVTMRQRELARLLPPEPRSEGEYVLLEVRDNGSGVPEQDREKIFDPFFTTHESGRGLGLAACLGIVRGHRGFIGVTSAPGGGALFRVGLPARTEGRASTLLDDSSADEVTPGTGIVLVVDDEPMVRHVACMILRRAGYEVIEAHDGIEAIELADANATRVSLVLLDLSMPRMGGREALGIIRKRHPRLPILLMSGYPEADACVGFRRRDLAGFLQKPFRTEALRKIVGEIIPPTML